jgi:hypothetical protein
MNFRLSLSPAAGPTTFHTISLNSRFPNSPNSTPHTRPSRYPPRYPRPRVRSCQAERVLARQGSTGSRPLSPLVLLGKLLQDGRSKLRALSPLSQSISPCAPSSAHLLSPLNRRLLAVPRSSRTFRLHNLPPLFRPNAVQYGPNPTSTRSHITSLPTP